MRAFTPALAMLAGCGAVAIDVTRPAQVSTGEVAPPFVLPSPGGAVALTDALADGAALLVFYRGHW
ncbi:MAG TPA: hypothetical protein VM734_36095 [Kofleriaceae bacterium]|nr:hypothetical protein [Kofleriaceae bacterium]